MLPLTLGRLMHEERQRQIESDLERRRLLAPSESFDEPVIPVRSRPAVPRAHSVRRAPDPCVDCPAS
jgi:hypothetical protein